MSDENKPDTNSTPNAVAPPEPKTRPVPGVPFAVGDDPRRNLKGGKRGANKVRRLARTFTEEAVLTLVHLMRNNSSGKVQLDAACALLDRGYGKPRQPITGAGENEPVRMADTALLDWLKKLEEHAKNTPEGERPTMLPAPVIQAVPEDDEESDED